MLQNFMANSEQPTLEDFHTLIKENILNSGILSRYISMVYFTWILEACLTSTFISLDLW